MQPFLDFYLHQLRTHAEQFPLCRSAFLVYDKDESLLPTLLDELQSAINLFNQYSSDHTLTPFSPYLKNANHLSEILNGKKLPSINELSSFDADSTEKILALFDKFQFIKNMQDPVQLAIAIVPAFYRTALLAMQPYLLEQHAQVASAMEEMFGILALEGKETKIFHAVKHWIVQHKEENFDPRFAEKIQPFLEKGTP
ncbi:MAG: hypothetical protein HZA34_03705 [Candidatus Pacebacteria bacterium]|nr:hypothetical protein [Candidatus Paceibacterota bacterium]